MIVGVVMNERNPSKKDRSNSVVKEPARVGYEQLCRPDSQALSSSGQGARDTVACNPQ